MIKETINFLREIQVYPGMYVAQDEPAYYARFTSFIEGYLVALNQFDAKVFNLANMTRWYGKKYQHKKLNIPLSTYLKNENQEKTDEQLSLLFSDLLVDYFEEKLINE